MVPRVYSWFWAEGLLLAGLNYIWWYWGSNPAHLRARQALYLLDYYLVNPEG